MLVLVAEVALHYVINFRLFLNMYARTGLCIEPGALVCTWTDAGSTSLAPMLALMLVARTAHPHPRLRRAYSPVSVCARYHA